MKKLSAAPADALGGNSLALILGTLRQGEWELSSCTLKQLTAGRQVGGGWLGRGRAAAAAAGSVAACCCAIRNLPDSCTWLHWCITALLCRVGYITGQGWC
jgi:hypothetical protein